MPWRHATSEDGEGAWLAGCHLWTGYTDREGTPVVRTATGQTTARRVAYLRDVGPIPEGKVLHAMCGTALCVRADHMDPVDRTTLRYRQGQMVADRELRKAAVRLKVRGVSNREIARRTGVDEGTVRRVLQRRYYDPRRGKHAA